MADITPSKAGYIRLLKMILYHSTCQEDINWCQIELDKILGIEE